MYKNYHLFVMFLLLLCLFSFSNGEHAIRNNIECSEVEREALVAFWKDVEYQDGLLDYSEEEDCCRWEGVLCENKTISERGLRVTRLDLHCRISDDYPTVCPRGKPNFTSLHALQFLDYLDLSVTDLDIDASIGGLTNLRYLNMSALSFPTKLLPHLGNLSSLEYLDLSYNDIQVSDLIFLAHLTSLVVLDLSHNLIHSPIVPSQLFNLSSLVELNLGSNGIAGHLPLSFGSLCELKHLDLSRNRLNGAITEFMQGFSSCPNGNSILYLDLSQNQLEGEIPVLIGIFKHLQELGLADNNFSGTIPETAIAEMRELTYLSLGDHFEGSVTELLFMNLKKLKHFEITADKVIFNVTFDWKPPFRLTHISMRNCVVGQKFPRWILEQSKLNHVTLINAGISGILPAYWISKMSGQLVHLDLSRNQIIGKLPQIMQIQSSTMEPYIGKKLILSRNNISGQLPSWICMFAEYLQLNHNQLSGPIPDCFNGSLNGYPAIRILDISHNNLNGTIPSSLFSPSNNLEMILLCNNRLEGELGDSMNPMLGSLDLGGNMLSGKLPEIPPANFVIRLRSNYFHGPFPHRWFYDPELHILDLAENNLSGPIPSVSDLSLLAGLRSNSLSAEADRYYEEINEITKGSEKEYSTITPLLNIIDLSGNNLCGKIPEDLMNLTALGFLNLSMNHLNGSISENVGNLRLLESLDLSNNNLSGHIPRSISSMTLLNQLDLSYNNLEGMIPIGNQLQTLNDSSIYEGNPLLCGLPLPRKCYGDEGDSSSVKNTKNDEETEDDGNMIWFIISMVAGYVFGLGGVCFALWVSVSLRKSYFRYFRLY